MLHDDVFDSDQPTLKCQTLMPGSDSPAFAAKPDVKLRSDQPEVTYTDDVIKLFIRQSLG